MAGNLACAELTSWIDVNGVEYFIDDYDEVSRTYGAAGMFMPPTRYVEDVVPQQHGSRVRSMTYGPREVSVPVLLHVDNLDPNAFQRALQNWASRYNMVNGIGKLRVRNVLGQIRDLNCAYLDGWGIREADGNRHVARQRALVIFRAFDPFWYDAAATVFSVSGLPVPFFPLPPMRLSPVSLIATTTVPITGDVDTWPVWTITGPTTSLLITNQDTGEVISLSYSLAAGQSITIDTTPGVKTVTLSTGANLFSYMSTASSLFPLSPGSNHIAISVAGTTAATAVSLTYKNAYLTP